MSLFQELKRRNVFRVAIAYIISAWLVLQISDVILNNTEAPGWVFQVIMLLLAIGFFFALFFAWAFELTPEGIKPESEVDRSQSITPTTGRKLDYTIIAIMAVALAWFSWDKFATEPGPQPAASAIPAGAAPAATISDSAANPADKSVAVLPFLALSSGPDDAYFADGLTEEILNSLAQLPELLVTARTSAFQFKGEDLPPLAEIAARLGVKHIVEGSVRKAGDRLRVTAQLVRAADGFHLWSKNYDSTSEDTIQVQEDIAEKIATAMDVVLDDNRREAMRRAGLRDVEAFIAYQKGLEYYEKAHGEMDQIDGLREANRYFDMVVERVPGYTDAYLHRSDLFTHIVFEFASNRSRQNVSTEEREHAYENAVANFQLAAESANNGDVRTLIEFDLRALTGNWRGIRAVIDRAVALQGCEESLWLQPFATVFGYGKLQKRQLSRITRCDPLKSTSWTSEVRNLYWVGEPEAALDLARQGMEIAPGTWLTFALIRAHVALGQFDEAESVIDRRLQSNDDVRIYKTLVAAVRGDRDATAALMAELLKNPNPDNFQLLNAYAWVGDRERVNQLAAQTDQSESGYFALVIQAYWCACGAPWDLEATPVFAAHLEESGLPWPPAAPIHFPLKNW